MRPLSANPGRHPPRRGLRRGRPMPVESLMPPVTRRGFLRAGAAAVGRFLINLALPLAPRPAGAATPASPIFAPNAFIRIDRQGAVTLVMPMVEMGQGIYTAMAMLLAEELEVGLDQVRLEHAPPNDALYANSILHIQTTGLSASIRAFWTPLRRAGAGGRMLLIEAAAKQWGVDPSTCRAQHGAVLHSASSRRLGYGELADAAATLPVPARDSVPLKQLKDFTLIGTPAKRLDAPDKVDGRAEFGIDTRLEGMTIEAIYQLPFLAHAAMEPMNCTVHLRKDGCDIWVGTQAPTLTQAMVAELTGLPKDAVKIHNHLLGGGFGRRLDADGTMLAVKIAQQVNGPVKVVWSREEDIQHDMYRPYYYDRLSGGLDANGKPVAWTHRVSGSSVFARYVPPLFKNGLDADAVESAAEPPYAFPNIHVDYVRVEPPGIRTDFWRGVGATHNVFVVESF